MSHQLLLLSLLAFTKTTFSKAICHACFDGICFTRSQIFKDRPVSGQLAIDRIDNIVYFHYEDPKLSDQTVAFDLNDIKFLNIPDVHFSFAKTVDQGTGEVYIGGANGVYKYDPRTNVTSLYGLQGQTVWYMQFKDVLYYTVFINKGLYTFNNKQSKSIAALNNYNIDEFIIDRKDDIYFMSNFTIYKLKKGDKKPVVFSNEIFSLTTDTYEHAYFVSRENRGLYKLDYRNGNLTEVGAFGSGAPFRTVFDRFNNLIYYDTEKSKLYSLIPNYSICKVRDEGSGNNLKKMVSPVKRSAVNLVRFTSDSIEYPDS